MNGEEIRKVKKIKSRADKKNQQHVTFATEPQKPRKHASNDFEEEAKVISTKQKKIDDSNSKRANQIEQYNTMVNEEENDENLAFEDDFDDEWEEEEVVKTVRVDDEGKIKEEDEDGDYEDYDEEEITKKLGQLTFSDQPIIYEGAGKNNKKGKKKGDEVRPYLGTAKQLQEGETLEFDNRAYDLFHRGQGEWPCLTIDLIVPQHNRRELIKPTKVEIQEYPITVHVVAGTQAPANEQNAIYIMKWSQLHKTRFDDESDVGDDGEMEENDEPSLDMLGIKHPHPINRIRSMNGSSIVALWDESGTVLIYDGTKHTQALEEYDEIMASMDQSGASALKAPKDKNNFLLSYFQHSSEGFALGWSSHNLGLFATGSCDRKIHLYTLADENGSSWIMDTTPFIVHKGSVEDLQFSPENPNLLAACSVDGTIKFVDFRSDQRKKAEGLIEASETDVNVISWNTFSPNLIAAGSDDGRIQVWDIRYLKKMKSIADIQFHQDPITSIEFQPYEDSVITVASADNRITIWDFSVEADMKSKDEEIPDQMMFMHQGLEDVKEIKHHMYMPEVIVSTAGNGFNVFKPNYEEDDWEDDL